MNVFLDDNPNLPCEFTGSAFLEKDHNHIIKNKVNFLINNKLRNLFTKGPKNHENKTTDYQKAKENIIAEIKCVINLGLKNMLLPKLSFKKSSHLPTKLTAEMLSLSVKGTKLHF